ncbi:MAG: EAL domain-containing protein [Gemmatimonadaceae bacterium]|nr:EAL domain-containing protein [Gemmatimonadaceae bacterium]
MHTPRATSLHEFDESTSQVLQAQFALAERSVNGVRILVIGVLAIAAIAYGPYLDARLNLANLFALAPMLAWAVGQHFWWHARGAQSRTLSTVNALLDVSAVSILATCYGLFGDPNFAVKSPILSAYFVILAARPFTGSPRLALSTALTATLQYAAIVVFFTATGRLALNDDPTATVTTRGTSLLDEGAKTLLLLIAGVVATYATAWNERTLRQAVSLRRNFEARFRAVFEHSAVGVALLNEQGAVLEANGAMTSIVGASNMQLVGRRISDFATPEHEQTSERLIRDLVDGEQASATAEVLFARSDGAEVWGSVTVSHAQGARDVRLIAIVEDVTSRKALEAKLLQQAFYDGLTGLANRSLFRDRAEHALTRAMRDRSEVAVLFLDLDNFKNVNDTLGHGAGDCLLQVVANRLLNATRGCDTVARLGGDEFAVLLENVRTEADASVVAERITHALRSPIELNSGNTVRVSSSIGIARAEDSSTVDDLMRNADVAMYAAKSASRGTFVFFDRSMHTALVDRVMLEVDMRTAIEGRDFWVAYQPIVDLETRELTGMEALARWRHPLKGLIPPASFIPVAEETGLILAIGRLVLADACQQAAYWNRLPGRTRPLSITVNLSGKQLQAPDLHQDVREALASSGLDPSHLILEITESVIMESGRSVLERLRDLKELGVRLAIDDFGTGYSSLSYLQQFPVDILKIDRSFTTGLARGPNEDALARTIIALGDLLTLRTIAEGVEHEGQHERLRDLGCDYGQGYLFGKPISARDMTALLRTGQLPELVEEEEQRSVPSQG